VDRDKKEIDRSALERMNNALRHRGPDSDGFLFHPGVGLAMRRLAVIDLETGDQPIPNEDEYIWVIQNGEIYNFPDLRTDLEERGHRFRTNTDTECILHLYEEYNDRCVEHLRGMFAFALWDARQRCLLIARDRFGQKPLYYSILDGTLYFSSELTSLLEGLPCRPEVNLEAIDLYLSLQYIPDPLTAFQGVYKLPPAHKLVWRDGAVHIERYWSLPFTPKWDGSEEELAEALREKLREAVRIRMIADVPLGAHLSGGIDSSIVVALMAEMSSRPVKTFSVGFEEQRFSELPYARAVAERYATEHHEFILTYYGDIPSTIHKLLFHFGEPFADPSALPLYLLSEVTRQHVTVALNGDGGDDLLAGYVRYWLDPWANAYLKLPRGLTRGLLPSLMRFLPDRSDLPVGHSLLNGLKRLGQLSEIDPRASILRWGSYFSPTQRRALWRNELWDETWAHDAEDWLVPRFEALNGSGFLDRTLYTDIHTYLPGDLLVKADRMTMAHSLEGRSPFLDHELATWAARLPEVYKVHGRMGKYLLRKSFADLLPPEVQRRGKQGFGIPVGAWFRGPLVGWARELLLSSGSPLQKWFREKTLQALLAEHTAGRVDHGKRLWALFALAVWYENL
jgi:asparagine synthase (glutamine-hydrolysing)